MCILKGVPMPEYFLKKFFNNFVNSYIFQPKEHINLINKLFVDFFLLVQEVVRLRTSIYDVCQKCIILEVLC